MPCCAAGRRGRVTPWSLDRDDLAAGHVDLDLDVATDDADDTSEETTTTDGASGDASATDVADDLTVRISAAADGEAAVAGLIRFAARLQRAAV